MTCNRGVLIKALILCVLLIRAHPSVSQAAPTQSSRCEEQKDSDEVPVAEACLHNPVLWHDPGAITSLDLFYGQGGKDGQPAPPFKFVAEDMHGTNPKFDARDAQNNKWRVKLGNEARPEVVASRLLWAVGYFVNDDYVLESAEVENLHLTRGADMVADGHLDDARFAKKPEGQKKIGIWRWKENPFSGSKELNGLRVIMAVMNNWDLKDVNNAVFEDKKSGQDIFLVSDIGATFGTNGMSFSMGRSKGDLGTFEKSKFITHRTDVDVDFATPALPNPVIAADINEYKRRREIEWIGKNIPIADARWIGVMLKQLSHQQLVDAFRAGRFPPDEVERYVGIVEARISELAAL